MFFFEADTVANAKTRVQRTRTLHIIQQKTKQPPPQDTWCSSAICTQLSRHILFFTCNNTNRAISEQDDGSNNDGAWDSEQSGGNRRSSRRRRQQEGDDNRSGEGSRESISPRIRQERSHCYRLLPFPGQSQFSPVSILLR